MSLNSVWLPPAFILSASVAAADVSQPTADSVPDKSCYNLFHPTPRDLMREMSTDCPDQTESPHTVDAGHFQVEMDLVNATFDHDHSGGGDVQTTAWGTSVNLKAGLLNNVDIQFVIDPYVSERVEDNGAGTVNNNSGFVDFLTRLKINLWGNDGGRTALGVMPFIKWPLPANSLRNGKTEGGVIIPLTIELPAGWSSTVMTEFDFVNDGASEYEADFVNSITFSHDIGGYVEFFSVVSSASNSDWQRQADAGFTYAINDNTVFDFGCNFGVTESAPDYNPFVGISCRF